GGVLGGGLRQAILARAPLLLHDLDEDRLHALPAHDLGAARGGRRAAGEPRRLVLRVGHRYASPPRGDDGPALARSASSRLWSQPRASAHSRATVRRDTASATAASSSESP